MSMPYAVIRGDGQPQGVWGHREWLTEPRPEVSVEGSAKWLAALIARKGVTTNQLARMCETDISTAARWRRGERSLHSWRQLRDIVSALPDSDENQVRDGIGRVLGKADTRGLDLDGADDEIESETCKPHEAVAVINREGITVQGAARLAAVSPNVITKWSITGMTGEDGVVHYLPRVRVLDRQCILKSDLLEFVAKVGRELRQDGGGGD